jgi:hypothetical protein
MPQDILQLNIETRINCIVLGVRWQDCTLWQSLGLSVGSWGFANVCNVGGILFFCAGGRKNKINSLQTAPPYQRSTKPLNSLFVIIPIFLTRVNVSRFGFLHLHTTAEAKSWRAFRSNSLSACDEVY